MRYRSLLVVALVAMIHLNLESLQAAKPKASQQQAQKKHKHHPHLTGTVVAVHHNKEKKGHGSIKVQIHQHPKKANQNQQAQAKVARNAAGQQKKQHHTAKIHIGPNTKFAHVAKGMVSGKPQVKSVGKGKNKSSVVVPGKPKMATLKSPAHFKDVLKGQHIHIKLSPQQHHHATEVEIHPTKNQGNQQAKNP